MKNEAFHIDKLRHIIVECLEKNGRQLRSQMIGLFKNHLNSEFQGKIIPCHEVLPVQTLLKLIWG